MTNSHSSERSFFSAGSRIEGNLEISGEVQLEGEIRGKIVGSGTVRVGEHATLDADIDAPVVVVEGTVRGKIRAAERLEMCRSAKVNGLVKTIRLRMNEGAFLEGECRMASESGRKEPAKLNERHAGGDDGKATR